MSLVDDTKILQEDAKILKVIESYCTSARARRTVNSCKYVHGVSVCGCVSNYGFWWEGCIFFKSGNELLLLLLI